MEDTPRSQVLRRGPTEPGASSSPASEHEPARLLTVGDSVVVTRLQTADLHDRHGQRRGCRSSRSAPPLRLRTDHAAVGGAAPAEDRSEAMGYALFNVIATNEHTDRGSARTHIRSTTRAKMIFLHRTVPMIVLSSEAIGSGS